MRMLRGLTDTSAISGAVMIRCMLTTEHCVEPARQVYP